MTLAFNTLVRQADRDFDTLIRRAFGTTRPNHGFVPAADVVRTGNDVLVKLELPGVDADNLDVEVNDNGLVISGNREQDTAEAGNDGRTLVREIRTGAFRRQFTLPDGITGDQVEAHYDRGVLTVRIREAVRPEPQPTKVQINTN